MSPPPVIYGPQADWASAGSVHASGGRLDALKLAARENDPQALREAARQFESLFTRMLLSSMRAASFGDSLLGSDQQDFYQGMFDDQLAAQLSSGRGLGLADLLVEQLTRSGLAGAAADSTETADDRAPAVKPDVPSSLKSEEIPPITAGGGAG